MWANTRKRVVRKGESQRSNLLRGKLNKDRLRVSVLIKPCRITAISSQSNGMSLVVIGTDQWHTSCPHYVNLLPTSKPWYPIKQIHAHFANCSNILLAYFPPFHTPVCVWQQVTGLNRICIWNQRDRQCNSCREDGTKIVIDEKDKMEGATFDLESGVEGRQIAGEIEGRLKGDFKR